MLFIIELGNKSWSIFPLEPFNAPDWACSILQTERSRTDAISVAPNLFKISLSFINITTYMHQGVLDGVTVLFSRRFWNASATKRLTSFFLFMKSPVLCWGENITFNQVAKFTVLLQRSPFLRNRLVFLDVSNPFLMRCFDRSGSTRSRSLTFLFLKTIDKSLL